MKNFAYHTTTERAARLSNLNLPNDFDTKILELRRKPTIGLEIEKQNRAAYNYEDATELCERVFNETGQIWRKTDDGSLDNDIGFELVSPILPLSQSIAERKADLYPVKYLINADQEGRRDICGGHIHLGHPKYLAVELFQMFIGFFPLLYALYIRRITKDSDTQIQKARAGEPFYNTLNYSRDTGYSRAKVIKLQRRKADAGDFCANNELTDTRYNCISINGNGGRTLEFRIFPYVEDTNQLIWRIELLRLMYEHTAHRSEAAVSKMIIDPAHPIHQHLSELYTPAGIASLYRLFLITARDLHKVPFNIGSPRHTKGVEAMVREAKISRAENRRTAQSGRQWADPFRSIRNTARANDPATTSGTDEPATTPEQ